MSETIQAAAKMQSEMSLKLMDARAVLSAIEALFAHAAIGFGKGANDCESHLHNLVCIALDKVREADEVSDSLGHMLLLSSKEG